MSVLRKFMVTTLITGAAIAAPSAASAATARHVAPRLPGVTAAVPSPADAVPAKIRKVPCRSWTFNVYHGTRGGTCYEGPGTVRPDIKNVRTITTGENTGIFCVQSGTAHACGGFRPNQLFIYPPARHVELVFLEITRI
jgi:hypothetical protein